MRYARTRSGELFLSSTGTFRLDVSRYEKCALQQQSDPICSRAYGRGREAGHLPVPGVRRGGQESDPLEGRPTLDHREAADGHAEGVRAFARLYNPE